MVKRLGIPRTVEYCLSQKNNNYGFWKGIDKARLLTFANAVEPFLDKEIQLRAEGSTLNIYCKDRVLFDQLIDQLSDWIETVFEPANNAEQEFLNGSTKKVICNHIPFKTYPYKVYIKSTTPLNVRSSFETWIQHYEGKIKTPNHTQKWFIQGSGWGWIPTVYVKDSATLSMVGLFLGSNVQKVEEFIPRSSINSTINQEQLCQL